MRKAIFLFNESDIMPAPWLGAGYECWLFDGKHPDGINRDPVNPLIVRVGMWFKAHDIVNQAQEIANMVGPGVEFVASFAECTYLTTTGAKWFYHPDDKHLPTSERRPHPNYPNRRQDQQDAIRLAKLVMWVAGYCDMQNGDGKQIPWMLENPAVNTLNTQWRRPDHTFDPFEYGGYLPEVDAHPIYPTIYPPRDAYPKKTGIWCNEAFVMPPKNPVPIQLINGKRCNPGWYAAGGRNARTKAIRSVTPRGFAEAVFLSNANVPY